MDAPKTRQYPDIMRGKTIMYNHGFGSSAQSGTVALLRKTFPEARVIAYDLPLHPAEAMALIRQKVAEEKPALIIGSSMGGMYTEMAYGFDRICVNPAFEMAQTMKAHGLTGRQTWMNPRADGETVFLVTKALEKEYRDITAQCFTALETMDAEEREREKQRVWGLFGDKDDVVDTWALFTAHYPQAAHFHGGHRLDDRAFLAGVLPVARWIDDRQEGRERQIVYVSLEALRDDRGLPRASAQKAFTMLTDTYQVYIVAPAPTNDHVALDDAAQWVEQYFDTSAHDHVIFTNQPQLLYGDFFVTMSSASLLANPVRLGSDDMKTWDEIMTYFSRLHA